MLRQLQQQRLQQKLSPQQIQIVKLLELPTLRFEQRVKKELEENPLLEERENEYDENAEDKVDDTTEEFSLEDYINEEDVPSYRLYAQNHSVNDKHTDVPFSREASFYEHLTTQLGLRFQLDDEDKKLAEFIIGNIDDDGYLRRELDAIVDDLAFTANIFTEVSVLERILKVIQDFDPPGVGARDLQESLKLQIVKKKNRTQNQEIALKIITDYFDYFIKKNYVQLKKKLNVDEEKLKEIIDEIIKLNPKPGSVFYQNLTQGAEYIIPDFIIDMQDGELSMTLNSRNVPDLKINDTYRGLLIADKSKNDKTQKGVESFVKQKVMSAKWFLDAIKQRQQTLLAVMSSIMKKQKEFFIDGEERLLKPMILKDIADVTGLDISTVSRVSNSKYVQTHFGMFPLKYFFSESMKTESGEEVSTREIKNILQECVDNEDKKKPLTDEKLTDILQQKSYKIARRTVAKYRENLGIPIARLRKEL